MQKSLLLSLNRKLISIISNLESYFDAGHCGCYPLFIAPAKLPDLSQSARELSTMMISTLTILILLQIGGCYGGYIHSLVHLIYSSYALDIKMLFSQGSCWCRPPCERQDNDATSSVPRRSWSMSLSQQARYFHKRAILLWWGPYPGIHHTHHMHTRDNTSSDMPFK